MEKEAHLFSVRDPFQFTPYSPIAASNTISWLGPKGFQGEDFYLGENPKFGAAFTFYLKEKYETLEDIRKTEETKKRKDGETVYYPTMEELEAEEKEEDPYLIFTIRDESGEVINEVRSAAIKGINKAYWDLKYPDIDQVRTRTSDPKTNLNSGLMVLPGQYSVQLSKSINGEITVLSEPVMFEVKSLNNRTLPSENPEKMLAFHKELTKLSKSANSARSAFNEINDRLEYYKAAARIVDSEMLSSKLKLLEETLADIRLMMYGNRIKSQLEIDQAPSLSSRINTAIGAGMSSRSDPTKTSMMVKNIAESQLKPVIKTLKAIIETSIPEIDEELNRLGAPWTPGRIIDLED